ncbi:hypothetical protein PR048_010155 [Dryococelus australis]|uniref:Uncharacterized protein n=1 Tax=Dryococelus australis TaxID=614101 RepID=A0ABQ9I2Q2_9NEOP|nr:hypothetical protein PR048_010155 [Dryococelus australis]
MRVTEASMKKRWNEGEGETGDPEKTRRPTASSGTIPTCENPELPGQGLNPDRLGRIAFEMLFPTVHAERREHCTPVASLALSGDRALDVRDGVALTDPPLLGLEPSLLYKVGKLPTLFGATGVERLARSPPTDVNRVKSPAGSQDLRKFGQRVFSGSPVSPPLHSGAAPSSLQSPSSTLKMLRATKSLHSPYAFDSFPISCRNPLLLPIRPCLVKPGLNRCGHLASPAETAEVDGGCAALRCAVQCSSSSSFQLRLLVQGCCTTTVTDLICTVQRYVRNTARLARRSNEALGVRVSVALIAPSLLDLGRGVPTGVGVRLPASVLNVPPQMRSTQVDAPGCSTRPTFEAHGMMSQSVVHELGPRVPTLDATGPCRVLPVSVNDCVRLFTATSTTGLQVRHVGAAVAERLAYSPPIKANRIQSSAGSLRIFACGNRFLGDIPFPRPFIPALLCTHFALPSPDLKTPILTAAQISSLTHKHDLICPDTPVKYCTQPSFAANEHTPTTASSPPPSTSSLLTTGVVRRHVRGRRAELRPLAYRNSVLAIREKRSRLTSLTPANTLHTVLADVEGTTNYTSYGQRSIQPVRTILARELDQL